MTSSIASYNQGDALLSNLDEFYGCTALDIYKYLQQYKKLIPVENLIYRSENKQTGTVSILGPTDIIAFAVQVSNGVLHFVQGKTADEVQLLIDDGNIAPAVTKVWKADSNVGFSAFANPGDWTASVQSQKRNTTSLTLIGSATPSLLRVGPGEWKIYASRDNRNNYYFNSKCSDPEGANRVIYSGTTENLSVTVNLCQSGVPVRTGYSQDGKTEIILSTEVSGTVVWASVDLTKCSPVSEVYDLINVNNGDLVVVGIDAQGVLRLTAVNAASYFEYPNDKQIAQMNAAIQSQSGGKNRRNGMYTGNINVR